MRGRKGGGGDALTPRPLFHSIKLAAARIINFAVLIFYVVPYEDRASPEFLKQIQSLLLANCFWGTSSGGAVAALAP